MLQRIVELENPVRSVLGLLDDRLPLLEADEWILIKELCEVLTHFEEATKSVSGETYISASLVIVLQRGKKFRKINQTTPSSSRAIMEIQRYLEDYKKIPINANPLTFWKSNQLNFPYLSKLVRQKCCALATSVP
uniref:Uncharacterized protein LOC114347100 n=1 Tax=Diabrotica virgifera virgifera TaxID=50390 RepID=A0A6P7HCX1_DIAVI